MSDELQLAAAKALAALRAWEQWEADVIMDGECWPGPGEGKGNVAFVVTYPHHDKLVPELQRLRLEAKRALEAALAPAGQSG